MKKLLAVLLLCGGLAQAAEVADVIIVSRPMTNSAVLWTNNLALRTQVYLDEVAVWPATTDLFRVFVNLTNSHPIKVGTDASFTNLVVSSQIQPTQFDPIYVPRGATISSTSTAIQSNVKFYLKFRRVTQN